jgi:hypothetical protein
MVTQKQAEEAIVANYGEMEVEGRDTQDTSDGNSMKGAIKSFFWHGGSVYDAWFSCASNQVHRSSPAVCSKRPMFSVFSLCCPNFLVLFSELSSENFMELGSIWMYIYIIPICVCPLFRHISVVQLFMLR